MTEFEQVAPTAPTTRVDWAGIGLVVLGTLCFSTAIIFIRLITGLNPMAITFYRSLFAFLFFIALLPRFPQPLHVARYRSHIKFLFVLGAAMALTACLYTYAIQNTAAATAALLVNSSPLYVALLSPLILKEARPRYTWPGIVLAIAGVVLIANPGELRLESAEAGGILAAGIAGMTYAIPMFVGRHLRDHVTGITQIMWGSGVTALLLLPFAFSADFSTALGQIHYLIPLGVFSMGLSYLLMFLGLRRVSAQVVSISALMEPVFGVLIGMIFFAEFLTPLGAVGSLLVLASIYLISR